MEGEAGTLDVTAFTLATLLRTVPADEWYNQRSRGTPVLDVAVGGKVRREIKTPPSPLTIPPLFARDAGIARNHLAHPVVFCASKAFPLSIRPHAEFDPRHKTILSKEETFKEG